MEVLKVNRKVKSANGLFLQEMDVVEIGGNKYLAMMEGKKLVVKRYDEKDDRYKYLYTWSGREIIHRDLNAVAMLEVIKKNEWLNCIRTIEPSKDTMVGTEFTDFSESITQKVVDAFALPPKKRV